MTIRVESPAFGTDAPIPGKYTCDGEDVSPPLRWEAAPPETESFALICDDPDAPGRTWVHWVAYDIPAGTTGLDEGVATDEVTDGGWRQGRNDFKRVGYGGPCPPMGRPHRYYFKLYALDAQLDLPSGATKEKLLEAMKGHILDEGQLMGTYARRGR